MQSDMHKQFLIIYIRYNHALHSLEHLVPFTIDKLILTV